MGSAPRTINDKAYSGKNHNPDHSVFPVTEQLQAGFCMKTNDQSDLIVVLVHLQLVANKLSTPMVMAYTFLGLTQNSNT